ncbi:YkvA family protein [Streptomyces sp. EN27]|uniref:YkvA family protein n=1 Tax=Streptomyces sp. EN27 TaxID=211464 RepID=UPI000851903E|nr:YkvA family protein [Streptomyces sp. EN27]
MDTTTWLVLGAVAALIMLALAVVLLVRVFSARKLLVDAGIPLRSKALFWAAVIYTVSPVDLLPDPIYLDDIGFLLVALRSLRSAASAAGVRTGAGARGSTGNRAKTPAAPVERRPDAVG